MDRPTRCLPGVVRRTRAKGRLVPDDPRIPPNLLGSLRVPKQVRIVALLPDEDEMGGGHEIGDVRATRCWARERVGSHAEPATVITAALFVPQLLGLLGSRLGDRGRPGPELGFHRGTIAWCLA